MCQEFEMMKFAVRKAYRQGNLPEKATLAYEFIRGTLVLWGSLGVIPWLCLITL